jgi:hypothetical protein
MIEEIFIAQRQAEHTLRDQRLHVMQNVSGMASIAKAGGEI